MKSSRFASGASDPFCAGCGHTTVIRALQAALERHYDPHDVVLVTDIGCIGMADSLFTCHTAHGLHGRAPALAAGISMTRQRPGIKVVALMGDGGAAIGLQHILECARINADMTLVVCNNQNYGMTGGQHSAYTLPGVRTSTTPQGAGQAPYRLCELAAPLGVLRSRTLATSRELGSVLDEALLHEGFSLVETINYCPSYSGKLNPEHLTPKAAAAFFAEHGIAFGRWPAETTARPFGFVGSPRAMVPKPIEAAHEPALSGALSLVLCGSAGEGVQSAAEIFAQAAMRARLHAVVRGVYPVTVGKGFSAAYLLMSSKPLLSTHAGVWDVALVTSEDGRRWAGDSLPSIRRLVVDSSLEAPPEAGGRTVLCADFRRFGARQSSFAALCWLLERERWFPAQALREAVDALPGAELRKSLQRVLESS